MPKTVSKELADAHKKEIVDVCEELYRTMNFKDVTLKEIGARTSFGRTSIYNYFQTKEEIFLALLVREYERWITDLEQVLDSHERLAPKGLAREISKTLERRLQLLKLMTMNHYAMEENSRIENMIEYKKVYGKSIDTVERLLVKFMPAMKRKDREGFIYSFFPFMYGIYPYAAVSARQQDAIAQAGATFTYHSVYEIAYPCIVKLLSPASVTP